MTKDEIKKGLECCCNSDFKNACRNCSYLTCPGCNDTLCKDALILITEQEQEIERLRTTLGQCNAELNSALESLKSQCREIGELKDDYAKLQKLFAQYQMASDKEIRAQIKQAKIDVLNELKEKIVEHMGDREYMGVKYKQGVFSESEIDEMIEEVQNAEDKS